MVRGITIAVTDIVTLVLVCMRGGQAFAVSCGRRCSGTISSKNNRLFSDAFLQPWWRCRDSSIANDTLGSTAGRRSAARRRFTAAVPISQQRTNNRSHLVVMASSTSYFSSGAETAGLPVKRHRNTFLLRQQHRRLDQQQGETATPTPTTMQPEWGQHPVDSSLSGKNGSDLEAMAGGGDDNGPLALVILNVRGESKNLLYHLWDRAALRLCADGGANRLHDSFGDGSEDDNSGGDRSEERARYVPDVIVGDLDSLRPEVASYYESLGCEIALRDDQDHCDFEKCLLEVESRLPPAAAAAAAAAGNTGGGGGSESSHAATGSSPATVVGLGAFGGRFDHEMQAFSLLHTYTSRFDRLVLMGAGNVAFLLEPGLSHAIEPDLRFEGPTVGLIPIGGPCKKIATEGLQWNLEGHGMEFGVLVSSSNCVVGEVVRVVTDAPLVWTAEFKAAAWMEVLAPVEAGALGGAASGVKHGIRGP